MSTEKKSSRKTENTKPADKTQHKGRKSGKNGKKKRNPWITILLLIIVIAAAFFIAKEEGYLEPYGIYPDDNFVTESLFHPETEEAQESPAAADSLSGSKTETASETAVSKTADSEGVSSGYTTSALEIPVCPATKEGNDAEDHEVHTYSGFTLCYRESYEDAEWVAYSLTKAELNAVTGRTDDFRADTQISTGSATPQDYSKSGYDRGHLAPAADMEWSEQSCRDSFLMSNMTPQAPQFNRGLWKTLEEQVRTWADTFGEVYVVTGPVLEKPAADYSYIGTDKVAVPEYFYKVLLAKVDSEDGYKTAVGIGFILPNQKCEGDIWNYAVSIDEVEQRTGLDFFSMMPDTREEDVEHSTDFSAWK